MKCKHEPCVNEERTKSPYCSKACKQADYRARCNASSVTKPSVTPEQPAVIVTPIRSRTTGCKVAIPGDEDYKGVCHKVDGKWQVKHETRYEQPICPSTDKGCEPLGCKLEIEDRSDRNQCGCSNRYYSQCLRDRQAKPLSRLELQQAIRAYPNDQWVNSPEHKELMHRLDTMTTEQLEAEGYDIPVRKLSFHQRQEAGLMR